MSGKITLLDGAVGTELQKAGLPAGSPPFLMCMTNPKAVAAVHASYCDAGAEILCANTFGADARSLRGTGYTVREVITRAIDIAKTAAPQARIALDLCPTGDMSLFDDEGLTFDDAYELFAEIVDASRDADLIMLETFYSAEEMRCALRAAKTAAGLPVFAAATLNPDGRSFLGEPVERFADAMREFAVDAAGINCSSPPGEMFGVFERLAGIVDAPLTVKLNAGNDAKERVPPLDYARSLDRYAERGAVYIGACCGSSPEYIRAIRERFAAE